LFFFFSFVSLVVGNQVYISPFGSDSPSGGSESNPFATLTFALSKVKNGDTIVVQPGVYTGAPNFPTISNLNVAITSDSPQSGPSTYIFDAQGTSSNTIEVSSTASASFTGLTFRNYQGSAGFGQGCLQVSSNVTVDSCIFSSNSVSLSVTSGNLTVVNSQFIGNTYGIYSSSSASVVTIRSSIIDGNGPNGMGQYGVFISTTQTFLGQNITIKNNEVGIYTNGNSGGVYSLELDGSLISDCTENGIYLGGSSFNPSGRLVVRNSTISNNRGTSDGAGIYIGASMTLLMQSTSLNGNEAGNDQFGNYGQGGGLYCSSLATINLDGVFFSNNAAGDGAAGWCSSSCAFLAIDVTTSNNTESKNTGPCQGLSD